MVFMVVRCSGACPESACLRLPFLVIMRVGIMHLPHIGRAWRRRKERLDARVFLSYAVCPNAVVHRKTGCSEQTPRTNPLTPVKPNLSIPGPVDILFRSQQGYARLHRRTFTVIRRTIRDSLLEAHVMSNCCQR
jgi:hypothetical protein